MLFFTRLLRLPASALLVYNYLLTVAAKKYNQYLPQRGTIIHSL